MFDFLGILVPRISTEEHGPVQFLKVLPWNEMRLAIESLYVSTLIQTRIVLFADSGFV